LKSSLLLGLIFWCLQALAINLTPLPPYLTETKGAPMVMLNLSKDHQLFFKAYNEFSDLDGDGVVETQYKHGYKYYGYFDNQRCYNYSVLSNRYVPVGKVDANGYCTNLLPADNWNGNFMNWATMARMDVVRRVLYGGFRAVDTSSTATPSVSLTVLERAHLPSDAHAFSKYYYGADINKLTPFNPAATTFNVASPTGPVAVTAPQISMCNVSYSNAAAPSNTNDGAPSILVAEGNHGLWAANDLWQCYWRERIDATNGNNPAATGIGASGRNPERSVSALGTGYAAGSYTARVEVCKTGLPGGFTSNEDSSCKLYPRGNYKPVGLLQKYGEKNEAAFGLITGSFDRNISGGVLRKNIESFTNEIVSDTGIFTSVNGIVSMVNKLKVTGYDYGNGTYESLVSGCNFLQMNLTDAECRRWGNPMGEIYLESLRYLAGATANPAFTVAGALQDTAIGLTVTAWSDPFATATVALFGEPLCRRSSVVIFNAGATSFDSDDWGGAINISGLSIPTVDLYTNQIGAAEGLYAAGSLWAVGRTGTNGNGFCSDKTLTLAGTDSFANATGICPETPSQRGSYKMAGAALYAHTTPIRNNFVIPANNTRAFKVDTYSVALSTGTPRIKIPVPGQPDKFVFISPSYQLDRGAGGGGTLVDYKVLFQTATRGKYLIIWNDSEQASNFNPDVLGTLEYAVNTVTGVISVTTDVVTDATANLQGFGYAISGTAGQDGLHFHSGILGFNYVDPRNIAVLPAGFTNATGGCANCQRGDPPTTAAYTMAGISGASLKDPLWYAAKYGGFDRAKLASTYVVGSTLPVDAWDLKSADGSIGADGVPDNYFLAVDPAQLEQSLAQIFSTILKAGGSAPALTPARVNLGGATYVSTQSIKQASLTADSSASSEFFRYEIAANDTISALPTWDAGLRLTAQNWDTGRRILSMSSIGGIPFRWTNLDAAQKIALRTNPQIGIQDLLTSGQNRLNWLRGDSSKETLLGGLRSRPNTKLGAIINSSPWYMGEPSAGYSEVDYGGGYASFKDTNAATRAVFVAANDGMLHAFNATTGDEFFGYVPRGLYATSGVAPFSKLAAITAKNFDLGNGTGSINADGSVMVAEMKVGGNWSQYLFGTLGRGGKGVYALDVTQPQNVDESAASISKLVKWEYGASTGDPDLGFIVSRPTTRANGQPFQTGYMANGKWAAIYGNGYNSASGRAALYIFFADGPGAGAATWTAGTHYVKIPVGAAGIDNGLGIATAVDTNNNGVIDAIYAGDLKGNVWKFDVSDSNPTNWKVATTANVALYQATTTLNGSTTVVPQPITTAVQPFRNPSGGFQLVFGTGKMLESNDYPMSAPYQNTVYSINEPRGNTNTLTVGRTDLVAKSTTFVTVGANDIRLIFKQPVDYMTKKGWYLDLSAPSEAVVFNPLQLNSTQISVRSIGPTGVSDGCRVAERALDLNLDVISGNPLVTSIAGLPQSYMDAGYASAGLTQNDRYDVSLSGTKTNPKPPACGASCAAGNANCKCNPANPSQCEITPPAEKCCASWEDCAQGCSAGKLDTDSSGNPKIGGKETATLCGDRRLTWREIIRNR
jgi:type IV pilus assembly protein PilY1